MASDLGPEGTSVQVLYTPFCGEADNILQTEQVEIFAEETKIIPRKGKIDPKKLELYEGRLKRSPAYQKVVGVGIRPKPTSEVVAYVRLDMDDKKGIHFNAVELSDSSKKLAAVLQRTVNMNPGNRETLYLDYIKALQNRSAQFIWEWWSTGKAPS